jgi:hypothetical protein
MVILLSKMRRMTEMGMSKRLSIIGQYRLHGLLSTCAG